MTEEFRIATPRVAAGVLFRDAQGQILLVKPTYKEGWDIPGGYVEPGESPRAAARREVREELGIDVEVGRLLLVDWAPHPDEGDKLLFVFEGGSIATDQIELERGELGDASFVKVARLSEYTPERLRSRLASAATSRSDVYAEHGS